MAGGPASSRWRFLLAGFEDLASCAAADKAGGYGDAVQPAAAGRYECPSEWKRRQIGMGVSSRIMQGIGLRVIIVCRARGAWTRLARRGGVAERLKAPVLKTGVAKVTAGSNPVPSANAASVQRQSNGRAARRFKRIWAARSAKLLVLSYPQLRMGAAIYEDSRIPGKADIGG